MFSGSVCTQEFYNYTKQLKNILGEYPTGRYAQNIIALKAGCADSIKLKSEIDSLERLEGAYIKKTVLNTRCAYLAVIALMNSQNGIANYRQDEMSQLRARFRDSKQVQMQLDMNQKLLEHPRIVRPKPANGTYFTSFTLPNAYGKKINLEQFKGKFVLIDFWASWCAPCRKESPFLRKSLEQFGKNNLVIISVSIDENRKSWLKAIERDGTSAFVHLIDDNGWKSLVIKQYNIDAIPANFLLSPDGKILEKDLRGEKLVNTLSQVLQAKTDVN